MDYSLLEPCLDKHGKEKGSLITILQEAQGIYGWLSTELLEYIAEKTEIPAAKIMGVATFYAGFRDKPAGKNLILLCQGTACHVNGSAEIENAIKDYLKINEGEITENGLFSYNNVACLGCCSLSPVMMINDKAYGKLTRESAVKILKTIEKEEEEERASI
ncbi:MAG: NAD(P)H-dependent oxidoreductase subunit E [Oscillospiraceae bacterium]|nr:NAD(P)H-dependent oxidoreductase subunit E [Oscillospiraceae bacterium]